MAKSVYQSEELNIILKTISEGYGLLINSTTDEIIPPTSLIPITNKFDISYSYSLNSLTMLNIKSIYTGVKYASHFIVMDKITNELMYSRKFDTLLAIDSDLDSITMKFKLIN